MAPKEKWYLCEFFTQDGKAVVYHKSGPLLVSSIQLEGHAGEEDTEKDASCWEYRTEILEKLFSVSKDSYSYLVLTELTDACPESKLPS